MKINNTPISSLTAKEDWMPSPVEFGFVPSATMTRESYVAEQARENVRTIMNRGLLVSAVGCAGLLATKALNVAGNITGKKGFYAAAAATGVLNVITVGAAASAIIDEGIEADYQIHQGLWKLPETVRTWKHVGSVGGREVEKELNSLDYSACTDGVLTVEELVDKRTDQVCRLLDEAGMDYIRSAVHELIENHQFKAVEMMVQAAKKVIASKEEADRQSKIAAMAESQQYNLSAEKQSDELPDYVQAAPAEEEPEW